jgi:FHA domain-containing protein
VRQGIHVIEISVVSYSGRSPSDAQSALFGRDGGTIGRAAGNTLTLADPERHLSRVQARFADLGNGRFEIANVSHANSIFVGDTEIEPQEQAQGSVGVTLRMGMYVLRTNRAESNTSKNSADAPLKSAIDISADRSEVRPTQLSSVPDPFADLVGASNVPRDAAPSLRPARPSSSISSASTPTRIPEDFDPFSMPSAAYRNSDNPLRDLANDNDVSLRNVFEDVTPVNRLIDAPDHLAARDAPNALFDDASSALNDSVATDPLKLFGGTPGGSSANSNPLAEFATGNHANELAASFSLPSPIFEDKKPIQLDLTPAPERKSAASFASVLSAGSATEPVLPISKDGAVAQLSDDPLQGLIATASPIAEPSIAAPESPRPRVKNPAAKTTTSATSATASSASKRTRRSAEAPVPRGELIAALLEGAGVPDLDLPDIGDEELMRRIGAMLRASIDGAVDLMSARAVTKREVRAEVTMIVSRGNNPLKFAPDGEAATMQLLGTPFPGFMPPVESMKDAFDDLRAHQIGVIAGSRAAFSAVLQRFDPANLETKLGMGGVVDSLMPSARRSKLWMQYTAMFEEILKQAEDDYGALFGEAFRRAYEEEVERVIGEKRGGGER